MPNMNKVILLLLFLGPISVVSGTDSPVVRQDETNDNVIRSFRLNFGSEWEEVYRRGLAWLEIYNEKLKKSGRYSAASSRHLSHSLDGGLLEVVELKKCIDHESIDYQDLDNQFCDLFENSIKEIEQYLEVLPSKLRKIKFSWLKQKRNDVNCLSQDQQKVFKKELSHFCNDILEDKILTGGLWSMYADSKTGALVEDELCEYFSSEANRILKSYISITTSSEEPKSTSRSMLFSIDEENLK